MVDSIEDGDKGQCVVGSGGEEWDSLGDGVEGQSVRWVLVVMSGTEPFSICQRIISKK